MPLSASEYQWNVALYSNYTADVEKLVDEDEVLLVRLIRKEMRIPRNRKALWHYDYEEGSINMRCTLWKLPSKETEDQIRKAYADLGVTL